MWPDLINGSFELVGAYFTWRNWLQLRRDRTIAGVYWPTTAFFAAWGMWNLIYYPALGQWASFIGGVALVAGNVAWVVLVLTVKGETSEGLEGLAAYRYARRRLGFRVFWRCFFQDRITNLRSRFGR